MAGYGFSALTKPFFYFANTWAAVAGARWADRVGKGIRTARDALVADSIDESHRGLAFGFHRAADTARHAGPADRAGHRLGRAARALALGEDVFRTIVLVSIAPALLAVASLAFLAAMCPFRGSARRPEFAFRSLGRPFMIFMLIVALFDLGNSSGAFLVLRAQERGLSVAGILGMLITFNLIYTVISTPAGAVRPHRAAEADHRRVDRLRRHLPRLRLRAGRLAHLGPLRPVRALLRHGVRHGQGAGGGPGARELRGTAYGTYNATLGILDSCVRHRGRVVAGRRRLAGLPDPPRPSSGAVRWRSSPLLLAMSGIGRASSPR